MHFAAYRLDAAHDAAILDGLESGAGAEPRPQIAYGLLGPTGPNLTFRRPGEETDHVQDEE
jgi:hypothetical protein